MHQIFQSLPLVPPAFRLFFYGMAALALALFALGTIDRVSLWTQGRERPNSLLAGARLRHLLKLSITKMFSRDCLLAAKTMSRSHVRGGMLIGIVWGSLILLAGVLLSALMYLSPVALLASDMIRVVAFLMDIGGGLLFVGLLIALVRRYFFHPARWVSVPGDGFMLVLFTLVVVLGFVMEGARLAGTGFDLILWYPVGAVTGVVLMLLVGNPAALIASYPMLYLFHASAAFALIAYVPFSRLFHVFASQITTFAAKTR